MNSDRRKFFYSRARAKRWPRETNNLARTQVPILQADRRLQLDGEEAHRFCETHRQLGDAL